VVWGAAFGLAAACTEPFTGIDDPAAAGEASSAGESSATPVGGSNAGGGGKAGGNAGRAGTPNTAGSDGGGTSEAGTGGVLNLGGAPLAGMGGMGGSGPEPVPVSEEGLELWLRADQGVVANQGVVGLWKDSSKNQRDAGQTAGNYRPLLVEGAIGKAAVVFDGQNDYLKLPPLDADFAAGVSIFAVAYQTSAGECGGIFEASNGSEIEDLHLGSWNAAALYEVGANYAHAAEGSIPFEEVGLFAAVHQPNGVVRLRRNTNGLVDTMFALPPLVARQEVFIGHTLYSGCGPFSGAVAELLLYSRSVSDEELVEIETYLQKKWGLL
jgi:hypothetical protein